MWNYLCWGATANSETLEQVSSYTIIAFATLAVPENQRRVFMKSWIVVGLIVPVDVILQERIMNSAPWSWTQFNSIYNSVQSFTPLESSK